MHDNPVESLKLGTGEDLTIVLVHGRTQSAQDMKVHAERLGLDNVTFLFPLATGNTWYPGLFMAPIAENEPALSAAIAHYEAIVAGLIAKGIPADRIVVGGFSQGACLTSEFLARHPRRYAAAILWTGGLIGPAGSVWPLRPVLSGMPAYITTAENDPWVPTDRVEETFDWLRQSGARPELEIFEDREHGVLDVEIAAVRRMIEAVRSDAADERFVQPG